MQKTGVEREIERLSKLLKSRCQLINDCERELKQHRKASLQLIGRINDLIGLSKFGDNIVCFPTKESQPKHHQPQ